MVVSLAPRPAHRALVAPLLAVLGLVLAGCTYVAPMDTTRSMNPGDGLNITLGPDVSVSSLLVVTKAEGDPGVLVARVVNVGSEAATVSISGSGVDEQVDVPANRTASIGGVVKGSQEVVIDSVDQAPGKLIPLTLSSGAGERKVQVPVLDGTLEQYAPYLREAGKA